MHDLPDGFFARVHDPRIARKLLSDEIGGLLFDALTKLREMPLSVELVARYKHRLELDILKYARAKYNWSIRDLPVHITFDVIGQDVHLDLEGPLAVDIYVSIQEFAELGRTMPLPEFISGQSESDAEEEDEDDGGWSYGR